MKQRSPALVIVLTLITFGIYGLVWTVSTKEELNSSGAEIPTAWLLIVPIANIFWLWKYAQGVETVTKQSAPTAFLLMFLLGPWFGIGYAIMQSNYNKHAA